jgi:Co/Zn/Cd efflux system component
MLMEATPDEIDTEAIEKTLESLDGVDYVHDMHVWSLSAGKHAFIVHLKVKEGAAAREVLRLADSVLR